eukprot:TRINITY_DN21022_c0_g1_i1.p1 TRINITY_DN21022_c0_g1~~TRINITY_DN21022_c0_g1_i1.p1  ORF type:complete len:112 (-),score=35.38 TRINITY_DN21022_c0_g1_i1:34-369(-)
MCIRDRYQRRVHGDIDERDASVIGERQPIEPAEMNDENSTETIVIRRNEDDEGAEVIDNHVIHPAEPVLMNEEERRDDEDSNASMVIRRDEDREVLDDLPEDSKLPLSFFK